METRFLLATCLAALFGGSLFPSIVSWQIGTSDQDGTGDRKRMYNDGGACILPGNLC